MKAFIKLPLLFLFSVLLFTSCDDSDTSDGPPPTGENITTEILAKPGDQISLTGTFSVENGFSKISISNSELLLDKQIVFANHVNKYFLDYNFTVPADASLKIYDIIIVAENLSGNSELFTIKLDVATPPASEDITLDFAGMPGDEITFSGIITDEQGMSSVQLVNSGIGLDYTIDLPNAPKEYVLNYSYTIPLETEKKLHKGSISVSNIANRTTSFDMVVNLSGEDVVYENIYVAGNFQWWDWRPDLAYPMENDMDDSEWFEVNLACWDGEEEFKFIGQLDWAPDNWGLVDQADVSQGMLNDESSATILLGANGGNPAYKKVRFNPYSMQYTVEDLTEVVTPRTEMYIIGKGFTDYPNLDWNPEEAIPMTANPNGYGEHIFMISGLKFADEVDLKFIGQTDGWAYDAGFDVEEQEVTAPISWAKIKEGDGSKDLKFKDQAGTYTVLYDYYLKRALIWKEE